MSDDANTPRKTGGMGFWSGFRFGIGFVAALMVMATLTGAIAVGGAWWAFGSVKGAVTAGARTMATEMHAASRDALASAGTGLVQIPKRAIAGTTEAVSAAGTVTAERTKEARDAVSARFGALAARVRGRLPDLRGPAATVDATPPRPGSATTTAQSDKATEPKGNPGTPP